MYSIELYRKFYVDIDVASSGCRARNSIINKWRECGDLGYAIDMAIKLKYAGINIEQLLLIKERYLELNDNQN